MLKPIATLIERDKPVDEWKNGEVTTELYLDVTWIGAEIDRPSTGGWLLNVSQRSIAQRLVNCINAGKAFKPNPEIKKDIFGKTYVASEQTGFFHKKHMNASLKKLGF